MLARIVPVLGYERDMVRLEYERLPPYNFAMSGLKKVLTVMERHFQEFSIAAPSSGITLQFTESHLDSAFRATNHLLVEGFKQENVINYHEHYRVLLDSSPPGTSALEQEGTGCGLISVFIEQSIAEYTPLVTSDVDDTFLRGLEDNLVKVASDFF